MALPSPPTVKFYAQITLAYDFNASGDPWSFITSYQIGDNAAVGPATTTDGPTLAFQGQNPKSSTWDLDWGDLIVIDIDIDIDPAMDGVHFMPQAIDWNGQPTLPQFLSWTFRDGHKDGERRKIRIVLTNPDAPFVLNFSMILRLHQQGSVLVSPDPTISNREPPPD